MRQATFLTQAGASSGPAVAVVVPAMEHAIAHPQSAGADSGFVGVQSCFQE